MHHNLVTLSLCPGQTYPYFNSKFNIIICKRKIGGDFQCKKRIVVSFKNRKSVLEWSILQIYPVQDIFRNSKFLQTHEGVCDSNPNSKLGVGNHWDKNQRQQKWSPKTTQWPVPSNVVSLGPRQRFPIHKRFSSVWLQTAPPGSHSLLFPPPDLTPGNDSHGLQRGSCPWCNTLSTLSAVGLWSPKNCECILWN